MPLFWLIMELHQLILLTSGRFIHCSVRYISSIIAGYPASVYPKQQSFVCAAKTKNSPTPFICLGKILSKFQRKTLNMRQKQTQKICFTTWIFFSLKQQSSRQLQNTLKCCLQRKIFFVRSAYHCSCTQLSKKTTFGSVSSFRLVKRIEPGDAVGNERWHS